MRKVMRDFQPTFPAVIAQISPVFVDIFEEAAYAESYKLSHVAGLAYGKSLEFLVKDYAISRDASRADEIRRMPLAQCIRSFLHDPIIQGSSELAAWLRNDEAQSV